MSIDLYEQTLKLIKSRPAYISLKQIAIDTGIDYNWVSSFHMGKIKDPKFQRLKLLHDYLIGRIKQSA